MNSKKKYEAFPLPILNPIFSSLSSSFYSEDGGINILQNTGVRLHDSTVHKIIIFIVTAMRTSHLRNLSRIPMTMAFVDQTEAIVPDDLLTEF